MRRNFTAMAGLVVLAALTWGCNRASTTSPTLPGSPSAITPPTAEMFTGTVPPGGSDAHSFTVALNNGQLTLTLTAAGPPSTISMGLGLGTVSGDTCTLISGAATITSAGPAPQLGGTATAGQFCVLVFDAGNQIADVTYAVTVTHY